jgi:hypothetical protein
VTEEHLSQKFLNQALARIAALERLVKAKDEALRVFAIRGYWAGTGIEDAPKWIGGIPGNSEPWHVAQAALDLKCEEVLG